MITIKDIAKSAGVSHTTVSRALRGDTRIPPHTTARIVQLADEMGYVPNSIAQSLSGQPKLTIGMLVTSIADPVVMDFVEGAEGVAQDRGYSIFISTSRNDAQREQDVIETFRRRRVDGVIVVASRTGIKYTFAQALDQIQVPVVLLDSEELDSDRPSVDVDNIGGASLAVQHLLELGHQRIGYIGATNRPLTNIKRQLGSTQALEGAGISSDSAWIINPATDDDIKRGHIGAEHCLRVGVTAIFCYNDQTAIGAINACYSKGISVPKQLSIVGYDDIRAASYITPPLTTVRQPLQMMGKRGVEILLALINKEPTQSEQLDCKLVVRKSTAFVVRP
ncbi:MAG: LacI family DNA-binding transcriptional regulator [Caldilineaceae bacterium]|nr:LacI family DNA-binding transcriptional regulator [Caldilineaceae bacterium]